MRDARHNLRDFPWARVRRGEADVILQRGGLPPARLAVELPTNERIPANPATPTTTTAAATAIELSATRRLTRPRRAGGISFRGCTSLALRSSISLISRSSSLTIHHL